MADKSYFELLQDPRWQRRKTEIQTRDKFTCQTCGDTKTTLNVHHKFYIFGRMPWEYDEDNLILLCKPCHDATTREIAALRQALCRLDPQLVARVRGYVTALSSGPQVQHNPDQEYDIGIADCLRVSQDFLGEIRRSPSDTPIASPFPEHWVSDQVRPPAVAAPETGGVTAELIHAHKMRALRASCDDVLEDILP